MRNVTRAIALLAAVALLATQIQATIEYSEGGSIYALQSMIVALCGLAVIPLLAIAAWRDNRPSVAAALALTTLCLLAYTLPATVGRSAEQRERKAIAQEMAKQDSDAVKRTRAAMIAECASGEGPKCRGLQSSLSLLHTQHKIETGDLGTEILAWALGFAGVTADALRKISALAVGLGYDIGICALVAFASHGQREREVVSAPATVDKGETTHAKPPGGTKPPTGSLAEQWLADHVKENPDADEREARRAYEEHMAGQGGRRMTPARFRKVFQEMAAA